MKLLRVETKPKAGICRLTSLRVGSSSQGCLDIQGPETIADI